MKVPSHELDRFQQLVLDYEERRHRHRIILPWQVGCEFLAATRKLSGSGFTEEQAWSSLEVMREIAIAVTMPDVSHWEIAQRLS